MLKIVQKLYFLSTNCYLRMLCHIPVMKYKCNFVLAMIWKLYLFTWVCYRPKKCPKSPQIGLNCKVFILRAKNPFLREAAWPAMKMKLGNKSILGFLSRYGPNLGMHGCTGALKKLLKKTKNFVCFFYQYLSKNCMSHSSHEI